MKLCCFEENTLPVWTFLLGTVLGLLTGLSISCCPSRRSMKKMAKRTAHTVSDAVDNLRDSLQQYL